MIIRLFSKPNIYELTLLMILPLQKRFAHPYHIREHYPNRKKSPKELIAPKIIDGSSEYVTRTILVRYIEEECDFNEVCHFRSEFDAYPDFNDIMFYMEAELMYSDMNMNGPLSKVNKRKGGRNFYNELSNLNLHMYKNGRIRSYQENCLVKWYIQVQLGIRLEYLLISK